MEKLKFPVNQIPYQNVDSILLNQLSDSMFDGFIDELGFTNKRPGFLSKLELGTGATIDGLYWWENRGLVIIVAGGRTYKIINESGTFVDITGDLLNIGIRPTFTDNGDIVVIANGGRMVFTDSIAPTTFIADPDAPTEVTHVAFLDQFIIANEVGSGRFHFADFILAPTTWFAIDVFTAEADPDNIIALYVNKRIINIFGTKSIEFWFNDGISPFSRLQGTTLQRGAMSAYTTVNVNETFYFFDDRRRLNSLVGQTPTIISTSFDKTIQGFRFVQDTIADYVTVDGKHWVIFTFPLENKSLLYDLQGNYWSEWTNWDSINQVRKRFLGNAYAYARGFNQHLFGSFKDDYNLEMKSSFFNDGGDQIRFEKTTGWIDYDQPDNRKRSYKITFRLKTGVGIGEGGNTEPFMRMRWRESGETEYGNFRKIGLRISGKRNFKITTRNLGNYYSRQWNIQMFEDVPFSIGDAIEGIDIDKF